MKRRKADPDTDAQPAFQTPGLMPSSTHSAYKTFGLSLLPLKSAITHYFNHRHVVSFWRISHHPTDPLFDHSLTSVPFQWEEVSPDPQLFVEPRNTSGLKLWVEVLATWTIVCGFGMYRDGDSYHRYGHGLVNLRFPRNEHHPGSIGGLAFAESLSGWLLPSREVLSRIADSWQNLAGTRHIDTAGNR